MTYNLRYIAQIVIEANTPLSLSSGEQDALTDSLVMTDANGLPMLPGTSLCGVLRHAWLEKEKNNDTVNSVFGYQGKDNDGSGSRLIVSNAHFVGSDGKVIEGLKQIDWSNPFYAKFAELPMREHCKISYKGAADAEEHGKFDNQVVYKGTRFQFQLELVGDESEIKDWQSIINLLRHESFRIGGGTRKGYGEIKIVSAVTRQFDLNQVDELGAYLEQSARLSQPLINAERITGDAAIDNSIWEKYELKLRPEDFYAFGAGFGDNDVDMTPVYEEIIKWDEKTGIPEFDAKKILIPASSVKGAISHRVAFHYNKHTGVTADGKSNDELEKVTGENNSAVHALFGAASDTSDDKASGCRGNVIFSDVFIDKHLDEKILNHVAIDRFTGGNRDGGLFDEKVISQNDEFILKMLVNKRKFEDEKVKLAFEDTLKDIVNGMLPLGGGTMRGHGCFNGEVRRNGEKI